MPTTALDDRSTICITGDDAHDFLQNLITTDLDTLKPDQAAPGALLTPQGKILFDFLISVEDDGYRLEMRRDTIADFVKRLTLYRLRAKVVFSESGQEFVSVSWGEDSSASSGFADLRFMDSTVRRTYGDRPDGNASAADWHAFRIAHGVAESGDDFALGDVFPHDVLYDLNGGVSFRKGCFVGQEVVSRMQHRGTARRRILLAKSDTALPTAGTEVLADGRTLGTLGTVSGTAGLALMRTDRASRAIAEGVPIMAAGAALELSTPAWSGLTFPEAAESSD